MNVKQVTLKAVQSEAWLAAMTPTVGVWIIPGRAMLLSSIWSLSLLYLHYTFFRYYLGASGIFRRCCSMCMQEICVLELCRRLVLHGNYPRYTCHEVNHSIYETAWHDLTSSRRY